MLIFAGSPRTQKTEQIRLSSNLRNKKSSGARARSNKRENTLELHTPARVAAFTAILRQPRANFNDFHRWNLPAPETGGLWLLPSLPEKQQGVQAYLTHTPCLESFYSDLEVCTLLARAVGAFWAVCPSALAVATVVATTT